MQVDQIQYDSGEGPCLSALAEGLTIRSDDIATDPRWPQFGPAAHDLTGVMSMLSHPLALEEDDTLGGLNLYSKRPAAFGWDSASDLTVLATHSAIAIARAGAHERSQHLQQALESNRTYRYSNRHPDEQASDHPGAGIRCPARVKPAWTSQAHRHRDRRD
ncbi:MAG: hypothetical protein QOK10_2849 [Pseudonocardiales bacterium]|jgi:GAF domain-containing protein|nr:hypothetical protein [Pseudonocardiales bacterium]